MTVSPLVEGKVIRAGKHRRRKSTPETRNSWKVTLDVLPPNARVNNFYTESVGECCLAGVPCSSQEWRNTSGQLHRTASIKILVEKREGSKFASNRE